MPISTTCCWTLVTGPQGTMALAQLQGLPERQRLTHQRVFAVCGDLWAKQVWTADLPHLQLRTLQAICLVEAHLPASEADVKLHDLLHLAFDVLPTWGEMLLCSPLLKAGVRRCLADKPHQPLRS